MLTVEPNWIKALSSISANACVELAVVGDMVALRNSRKPDDVLYFTKAEVAAFISGSRGGEFDHLTE